MSICEECVGDGSSIVAYEATRRKKRMFLFVNENMLYEMNRFFPK